MDEYIREGVIGDIPITEKRTEMGVRQPLRAHSHATVNDLEISA
jgi:hypothetical protein